MSESDEGLASAFGFLVGLFLSGFSSGESAGLFLLLSEVGALLQGVTNASMEPRAFDLSRARCEHIVGLPLGRVCGFSSLV